MTLPSNNKRLSKTEIESIEKAVEDAGIRHIHPEKMESFAEYLVQKLKEQNTTVEQPQTKEQPEPWRDGSPLSE